MTANSKATEQLASAIRAIAHGNTSGPTGLEMLAIALAGDGLAEPLSAAVTTAGSEIAEGLRDVASAIRELADLRSAGHHAGRAVADPLLVAQVTGAGNLADPHGRGAHAGQPTDGPVTA